MPSTVQCRPGRPDRMDCRDLQTSVDVIEKLGRCTRMSYHDGPCNGLPCKTALEHFDHCPVCGLSTQTPGEVRWETLREWCKSAWHRIYAKANP